jgi:hypothetical protein
VGELSVLDGYPWTGHAGLVRKNRHSWHSVDEVLNLFGDTHSKARKVYRNFIKDGFNASNSGKFSGGGLIRSNGGWEAVSMLRSEHVHCIGDERILGSGQFVERALVEDELGIDSKTRRQQQGWNLEMLVNLICDVYEIEQQELIAKARGNNLSLAKPLICFWGVEELGLTIIEIGVKLQISQQAASKWVKKGRAYSYSENIVLDDLVR